MSRRQRGVVLTDRGKQRLEAAIVSAQDQEKYGARFTQTELEDRAGLSIKTIKKIRESKNPTDKASVRALFGAFGIKELEPADYGQFQSSSFVEAKSESKQHILNLEESLRITASYIPTKEAYEPTIIGTTDLEVNSSLPDQRFKEIKERCCSKILQLYNEIQLLNRHRVEIDRVYVDTFILEGLTSDFF
ncbi:MAG: hypothetical protein AAFW95_12015, partial [Cyanobacteria bacterium J06638_6]